MNFSLFPSAVLLIASASVAVAGPVNINSADAATIARELKGIGLSKAQAIVDYRQKHGAFRSADELASVRGIGQKTIEDNRADIRIDRATARPPGPAGVAVNAPAPSRPAKPGGR
ncbi:MAG: helix-hairpin-helix domain-containing protein [Gammaproteobacteria bacterium]|nr:helix-hairpin-helix domain-containing protein [Gammaproteobacteria bacterium]